MRLCFDEALHVSAALNHERGERRKAEQAERQKDDDGEGSGGLYTRIMRDAQVGKPPRPEELRMIPKIDPDSQDVTAP